MTELTVEDLRRILTSCAGESDTVAGGVDILDTDFDDLGYDSLALMETAARIHQEFGVLIPDEDIVALTTPRALLTLVNSAPTEGS
ncbi:MAG TPA: acyl carrier protein [Mycobacteriales bacterium]|jgi:Acyl carrier protein